MPDVFARVLPLIPKIGTGRGAVAVPWGDCINGSWPCGKFVDQFATNLAILPHVIGGILPKLTGKDHFETAPGKGRSSVSGQ